MWEQLTAYPDDPATDSEGVRYYVGACEVVVVVGGSRNLCKFPLILGGEQTLAHTTQSMQPRRSILLQLCLS